MEGAIAVARRGDNFDWFPAPLQPSMLHPPLRQSVPFLTLSSRLLGWWVSRGLVGRGGGKAPFFSENLGFHPRDVLSIVLEALIQMVRGWEKAT